MPRNIQSIIKNIIDLPTFPKVVISLISLLDNSESSIKDITDIMGNDPTLVAKLLKLVNSSFYAIPQRISSIPQAISILGFKTIKSMVISAGVLGLFDSNNPEFSYKQFWTHSIGVATISKFIALKILSTNYNQSIVIQPDSIFIGGLLHGIGKIILDQYAHDEFDQIIKRVIKEEISFQEAEKGIIDSSYTELGYWVVKKWNLSSDIQAMIKYQNDILACPEDYQEVTAVMILANYLCRLKKFGNSGDFDLPKPPKDVMHVLDIGRESIREISAGLDEELSKVDPFLNMIND